MLSFKQIKHSTHELKIKLKHDFRNKLKISKYNINLNNPINLIQNLKLL